MMCPSPETVMGIGKISIVVVTTKSPSKMGNVCCASPSADCSESEA